jgi:outer membrane receptor protein involved in Fe transport
MAQAQEQVETVVVTGSRIPQQGLYSSSPVSVVGHEEFKTVGATNVENLIRNLPSVVLDGDNSQINNGTGGLSTVDLRGLGPQRTLVLIDGKRVQPADAAGVVDLAQIPTIMIDHVELLTGGASSTYGGDAVSGVVNLILRHDFEGVEANAQYTTNNYGDGPIEDLSYMIGSNSGNGKGNVTIYGEYYNQAAISDAARPWGEHVLSSPNGVGCAGTIYANGFCYGGSGGIPQGRITDLGEIFTGAYDGTTPPGNLVPYAGQTYSFAPSEFLQSQHQRYAFGGTGHYEFNKLLDFYTRVMFSDNDNHSQLAPVPINAILSFNCGNPLMTDQERTQLFGGTGTCASAGLSDTDTVEHIYRARMTASGNRNSDNRNTAYQIQIGARGAFANSWSYDISGQYGQTSALSKLTGDVDTGRFQNSLLSVDGVTCLNGDPSCVPADIFHQQIAINPKAATYYAAADQTQGYTNEWDAEANLVGDLGQWGVQSPWAKTPVGVAIGSEYRQEESNFAPAGPISVPGASAGYEYEGPVAGGYDVAEGYTEVHIPVIEDASFAQSLSVDGGYRFSAYNLAGDTTTWKAAVNWQIIDDFKLRGSYDRAVREPHVGELFGAAGQTTFPGYDPCGPVQPGQLQGSLALCEATGVPGANYGTGTLDCQGQCQGNTLPNEFLKPEVAVTQSVGFVFVPTFLPGFTATVDYYSIKINGAITTPPGQTTLNQCYSPAINKAQLASFPACQKIFRDSFGTIFSNTGFVALPLANIDSIAAKGVDVEAHYHTGLDTFSLEGAGSLGFDFRGTYVENAGFTDAGITDQCAGHYDNTFCSVPNPRWRHWFRLTWYSPDSDVSVYGNWRYFTSTTDDELITADPLDAHAPSASYFDIGGSWNITDRYTLYAGANNVLNHKPPLFDDQIFSPATENANTFPGVYDALGIVVFGGVTIKL